jgi:ATP-binding cassette subfamily C protein LapB
MEKQSNYRSERLLETLLLYSKRYGKGVAKETLIAGLPHAPGSDTPDLLSDSQAKMLFTRAAKRAGFRSTLIKRPIKDILDLHVPMILLLEHDESCILEAFNDDRTQAKVIYPGDEPLEEWVDIDKLEESYLGYGFLLKKELPKGEHETFARKQQNKHWFWDTLKLSWPIYKDVLVASFLVNLFVLASPLFTMNVYDRVIPNNATETLYVFAIGVIVVYLLDSVLKYIRTRLLEIAAKKSDVIMSSIIFEKIMDLKMAMHPRSVGSFASNIRDFDAIRSFLTNATMALLIDLPFSIIFLLVIYYIGGLIVLIPLTMMLLILIYAILIRKPLERSIEATHEAAAKKNGILVEALQHIETIKTQGMSGQIQWQWEESVGDIAQKSLKSRLLSASVPTITGLLVQLTTVFVIIAGVYMIKDLELTMGGLIGIVILASRTVAPMGQVAALLTNYSDAKSAYDVINGIISQPMERLDQQHFIERDRFEGKIEFRNVTFTYPDSDVPALKDVSFTVMPGEHIAIIGRIGSGKSTIEKLILKLYDPDSGSILIDDIDISQIDPARLRRFIGYVPQEVHLFKGTIKDNILARVPNATDEELLRAAHLSGADEFIKRHPMGFNMPVGERGQGLSGGQRQSIGIARALISDAPIMLLDEPTANLDQLSETKLMSHFHEAFKDKTLILVTQKLTLLPYVSRVIVMHEGKVYMDGPRDDVLKALKGAKDAQKK